MSGTLKASEMQISKIFSQNYTFYIPTYQRPYSWTENEAGTLLDDLIDAWKNQAETGDYFLGSIVFVQQEGCTESEVIDGQQRLTTLTILMSVLFDLFRDDIGARESIKSYIWEKGDTFQHIDPKARLRLREKDNDFFEEFILGNKYQELENKADNMLKTDAQRLLKANTRMIYARIHQEFSDKTKAHSFVEYIVNNCFVVAVQTTSEKSAFRVFSILNNRGLSLMPSDIIKAEVIGNIESTKQNEYTQKWEGFEELLGRDRFNALLSHIRMIYAKCKAQKTILEEFEFFVLKENKDSKRFIDKVMDPMVTVYDAISRAAYSASENVDDINQVLKWLNHIDDSDWVPPTIAMFVKYGNDSKAILQYIQRLDRLASYLYLSSKTSNNRIERYAKILGLIKNEKYETIIDSMELSDLEQDEFIRVLDGEIYNMPARKRTYALERLNSFVSDAAVSYDSAVFTIEHVLPQNVPAGSKWAKDWKDPERREYWVHRIGNLVPLTRKKNSEAQNYDFDIKKQKYFTGVRGTSSYALTTQVLAYETWTEEDVQERQNSLMNVFMRQWDIKRKPEIRNNEQVKQKKHKFDAYAAEAKRQAVQLLEDKYSEQLTKLSASMYVNAENKVYMILYSKYNEEGDYYWYSINDSRFDELKKYSGCNVLFIMGSNKEIISYPVEHLKLKLDRCGHSSEDLAKKKQAHYHFYLRITDKGKVLFKLSNPVEFEDVTRFVIKE